VPGDDAMTSDAAAVKKRGGSWSVLKPQVNNLTRAAMSYAAAAAQNTSGPQPTPDPALLTTESSSPDSVADDTSKVNVVPSDFKQRPATTTSEARKEIEEAEKAAREHLADGKRRGREEGAYVWELAKKYIGRPGVAGGLLGVGQSGKYFIDGMVLTSRSQFGSSVWCISRFLYSASFEVGLSCHSSNHYRSPRGFRARRLRR
jgi:parvulin-like peptidyl-prolyl isomerase